MKTKRNGEFPPPALTSYPGGGRQFQDDCGADGNSLPGQCGCYIVIIFPGERNHSQDDRTGQESPRAMTHSPHYQASRERLSEGGAASLSCPIPRLTAQSPHTDPAPCLGLGWDTAPQVLGHEPMWVSHPHGEGCQPGPGHEDPSHQKSEWSWNQQASALSPVCPLPCSLYSCSSPGIPLQSRGPNPWSLVQTPCLPEPSSSSYRSPGDPPAVGHQPVSPKQKTAIQPSKTRLQLGAGRGSVFPRPTPRSLGVPARTKKALFGGRKGPRQTGQAATTECEDKVMLLKLKKPPAQKKRRKWQCDRVTGSC